MAALCELTLVYPTFQRAEQMAPSIQTRFRGIADVVHELMMVKISSLTIPENFQAVIQSIFPNLHEEYFRCESIMMRV